MANESILVVEDEADIAELIRYNLDKEGFRVTCAETGEQAATRAPARLPSS
jgi:DNA-binding response OmpR family regulator